MMGDLLKELTLTSLSSLVPPHVPLTVGSMVKKEVIKPGKDSQHRAGPWVNTD
jgi:hypothetical protein